MIEIDSRIISPEALLQRVKNSAQMKNIDKEFFSGQMPATGATVPGTVDISRIRAEMDIAYHNLNAMNETWEIHETPITSHRPVIGKLIVFGKKVFRKLTRWLFKSYYEQQTWFNGAATRTISDMIRVQELLIQGVEQGMSAETQTRAAANASRIREEMVVMYRNLQTMNATWVIEEKPIVSHRRIIGKPIVFCKRVFRKLTRWLFRTYYDQQTWFNGAATRTISDLIRVQELLISAYTESEKKG